jgi:CubicO group peptidase (beta-lactamase class C family)
MMNRRKTLLSALGLSTLWAGGARAQVPDASAFDGRWGGIIGPPATGLRVVLEVTGAATPVLVSVDQGGSRIPATGGTVTGQALRLAFNSVRGTLQVSLQPDGTLAGTWSQGRALPITLTRLAAGQEAPERPVVTRGPLADEVQAALTASGLPALGAAWSRGSAGGIAVAGLRAARGTSVVTPHDLWHIGSITKSMTATLLARLVAVGTLRWDMTVTEGFGAALPGVHADLASVTLHELVTGRSGLSTNLPIMEFLSYPRVDRDVRASRLKWTGSALARAPETAPRGTFIYPNSGFIVAGCMAEQATGQAWEDLMRQEVFAPLGLTSAGFGPPDSANNPSGHRGSLLGGRVAMTSSEDGADNPPVLGPAGTVHMTLSDLARFGRMHAEGGAGRGDPAYLDTAAWRFLHSAPAGGTYACGLTRRNDGRLWHNGSNTMWYAELLIDPALGAAAAACSNAASDESAVANVLDAALQDAARQTG